MRRLPGTHPANIKNRSSKQLGRLCGPGHKPIFRSLSNAALQEMTKGKKPCREAEAELNRRARKRAKKEAK